MFVLSDNWTLSVGITKFIKREGYLTVQDTCFILGRLVCTEKCQI
jgi:hypothetical protein